MQTIELRQNKASITCMLCLLGLVAVGIFCFLIFRSIRFTPFTIILLLAACGLTFVILRTGTQLQKNKPLLTFFKEGLEIHESSQPITVLWQDIVSWEVRKQDATHYLILTTGTKRKSINISWLEVQPQEVEALMKTFIQSGTGSSNY